MTMQNEREAIVATADRIARRMGGRFVLNEDRPMTDKPEAVAWMYTHPSYCPQFTKERLAENFAQRSSQDGYAETPLYAHPQPDASALVKALAAARTFLVGSDPLHASNGIRNRDLRSQIDAALTAWEARAAIAAMGGEGHG